MRFPTDIVFLVSSFGIKEAGLVYLRVYNLYIPRPFRTLLDVVSRVKPVIGTTKTRGLGANSMIFNVLRLQCNSRSSILFYSSDKMMPHTAAAVGVEDLELAIACPSAYDMLVLQYFVRVAAGYWGLEDASPVHLCVPLKGSKLLQIYIHILMRLVRAVRRSSGSQLVL